MAATRDFLGNLGTRLAAYPLTFVASILVARTLGPHDRGALAFLMLFGDSLPIFGVGLGAATTYFIASNQRPKNHILGTATVLSILQGFGVAALFLVLWWKDLLGESGGTISARFAVIVAALLPLQSASIIAQRILTGQSRFSLVNHLTLGRLIGYPILLLVLTGPLKLGLHGAVLGWAIAQVILCMATIVLSAGGGIGAPFFSWPLAKDLFRYGLGAWIGDLASRVNIRVDRLVTGMFVGPTALGYYTTAAILMEIVWVVPDALSPILFNRMAKATESDESPLITESSHRLMMAWSFLIAALLGISAPIFVPLAFGSDFREASTLLQILLPGAVGLVSAKVLTKYFSASARPLVSSLIPLAASAVSAVLYFALVPRYDVVGAAIATSFGYLLTAPIGIYLYRRMSKRFGAPLLFPRRSDWVSILEKLPANRFWKSR